MRLIINRDQDKGFLGGMNFILRCRVELTNDEDKLIKKYNAHIEPLTFKERNGTQIPALKIGDLVDGVSYKAKDVTTLLNNEEVLKEGCRSFKNYLIVMASLGGAEFINI